MISKVGLDGLAETRLKQAKMLGGRPVEAFEPGFDTTDLHIRLWRATAAPGTPASELSEEEARKYLTTRRLSEAPTVLFDSAHYLNQLPWFVRGVTDALDHYLKVGWSMGLSPHLAFDTAHLGEMLDIKTWALPPLLVYFEHASEISAHPLFDVDIYQRYVSLEEHKRARLFEVFLGSWSKARAPFSRLFSLPFYGKFELVARYGSTNPLLHYLMTDIDRRRDPNPMLHNKWYDLHYPAKPGQDADPLVRFAKLGLAEGYLPNPFATQELKIHDQNARAPRAVLQEYVDVSEFDRRWYEAGASYGVLGKYRPASNESAYQLSGDSTEAVNGAQTIDAAASSIPLSASMDGSGDPSIAASSNVESFAPSSLPVA
jgi:hypothetical protein